MELSLLIEGQGGVTWPQWLELARACERHGIGTLYRSDHYLNTDGNESLGSLDAWATITALAAVTSTLRLGTMVSPATFRHPSELAKIAATADHVSGGRIEVGLGAGWHQREHAAYGFPFGNLRTRMDVLEEQLAVITGAWADGPVSFDGRHYQLDALDAQPKPVQRPGPPLIIGGRGGPRSLALAARFASEYNFVYPTLQQARERGAALAASCERAGRQPIPLSVMTAVIVGRDQDDLRARVTRVAQRRGLGSTDAVLAEPPEGWVVGLLEQVALQLRAFEGVGVSRMICQHWAHEDLELVELLGAQLAQLVA